MTVTCADCEPRILALRLGWASDPTGVAPTVDEHAAAERAATAAQVNQQALWADPSGLATLLQRGAVAQPPNLLDLIRAMSGEERDALRDLLGPHDPPAPPAPCPAPAEATVPRRRGRPAHTGQQ